MSKFPSKFSLVTNTAYRALPKCYLHLHRVQNSLIYMDYIFKGSFPWRRKRDRNAVTLLFFHSPSPLISWIWKVFAHLPLGCLRPHALTLMSSGHAMSLPIPVFLISLCLIFFSVCKTAWPTPSRTVRIKWDNICKALWTLLIHSKC